MAKKTGMTMSVTDEERKLVSEVCEKEGRSVRSLFMFLLNKHILDQASE